MTRLWHCLKQQWNNIKQLNFFVIFVGVILFLIGLLGTMDGLQYPSSWSDSLVRFHQKIGPELMGIGVAVLIIDTSGHWREIQQEKSRLIQEMGSNIKQVAIPAVEKLKVRGWLFDGSLRGAMLWGADLRGARLRDADLQDVELRVAKLQGARLIGANLRGAKIGTGSGPYLTQFDTDTTLPDGAKWTQPTDMKKYTDPTHDDFYQPPAYQGKK